MTITIYETPRGLSNVCPDQVEISYWFIYFVLLRTRLQKYFFLLVSFLRIYLFLFCRDNDHNRNKLRSFQFLLTWDFTFNIVFPFSSSSEPYTFCRHLASWTVDCIWQCEPENWVGTIRLCQATQFQQSSIIWRRGSSELRTILFFPCKYQNFNPCCWEPSVPCIMSCLYRFCLGGNAASSVTDAVWMHNIIFSTVCTLTY